MNSISRFFIIKKTLYKKAKLNILNFNNCQTSDLKLKRLNKQYNKLLVKYNKKYLVI